MCIPMYFNVIRSIFSSHLGYLCSLSSHLSLSPALPSSLAHHINSVSATAAAAALAVVVAAASIAAAAASVVA